MRFIYVFFISLLNFYDRLPHLIKYFLYRQVFTIHPSFRFNGARTQIYGDGELEFGENSYCGENCYFQLKKGAVLKVGSNCAISHNVRIYTSNKDPMYIVNGSSRSINIGDVVIGDNVWIGANVFINQGVTIGSNSVVGANSVVTKDIPSRTISAGSPCRVIKEFD